MQFILTWIYSHCLVALVLLMFLPRWSVCIQGHVSDQKRKFHKVLIQTPSNHSAVEMKYNVSFPVPEDNICPILYLRHDDQEESYDVHQGCFNRSKSENNYLKDKQLVWLRDCSQPGESKGCTVKETVQCIGELQIALGYLSQWYVSVGYICGEEKPVNLTYNISIHETDIACVTTNTLMDKRIPCGVYYRTYSKVNLLGYNERDLQGLINGDYKYFLFMQSKSSCYQYAIEFGCRTFFPECHNGHIIPPCRQMCWDFVNGCSDLLDQKGLTLSISCTAFPDSLDPDICIFQEVKCKHPGNLSNGYIVIDGNDTFQKTQTFSVGSQVTYSCDDHMVIAGRNKSRTCVLSGQWTGDDPECVQPQNTTNITTVIIVAILCSSLPLIFLSYLSVILRYVYLKYPYKPHCRKFLSKVYRYNTDEMVHDTFLVHGSSDTTLSFIGTLRQNVSPTIAFTSNDDILPGQREVPALDKAIAQSRCAIFVVAEDLLESENIELILDMVTVNRYRRAIFWCYFIFRSRFENLQNESSWKTKPIMATLERMFRHPSSKEFKPSDRKALESCILKLKPKETDLTNEQV